MYNILELRSKSQDELLRIAQELGVKKANTLAPDTLVYAILDQQAIVTSVDKKEEGKTSSTTSTTGNTSKIAGTGNAEEMKKNLQKVWK